MNIQTNPLTLEFPTLLFVNRKNTIITAIVSMIRSAWKYKTETFNPSKISILVSCQMLGSGKTRLGEELLNEGKKYRDEIYKKMIDEHYDKENEEFKKFIKHYLDQLLDKTEYAHISYRNVSTFEEKMKGFTDKNYFIHLDEINTVDLKELDEIRKACLQYFMDAHQKNRILTFLFTGRSTAFLNVIHYMINFRLEKEVTLLQRIYNGWF